MEIVSTIVTAMVAASAQLAKPAIRSAYQQVKNHLTEKFRDNPMVIGAIEGIEESAETWEKPLKTALKNTDDSALHDKKLMAALDELVAALKSENVVSGDTFGNYGTKIGSIGGDFVAGDKAGGDISKRNINTGGGTYVEGNMTSTDDK